MTASYAISTGALVTMAAIAVVLLIRVFEAAGHLAVDRQLQEQDALGADSGNGKQGAAFGVASGKGPCRATQEKAGPAASADSGLVRTHR